MASLLTALSVPGSRSEDAILKIFNDRELTGSVIKLRAPPIKPGTKKLLTNWQARAKQLESQG
jgi:hypothetical protein